MAPRTATAERFILEPSSLEETQRIFGMSDARAATLAEWAAEALRNVEQAPSVRKATVRKAAKHPASKKKKTSAKR